MRAADAIPASDRRADTVLLGEILPRRTLLQQARAELRVLACRQRFAVLRACGVTVTSRIITTRSCTVIVARLPRARVLRVNTNPATYTPEVA